MKSLTSFLLASVAASVAQLGVGAVPHPVNVREALAVWDPPVIEPGTGTVWTIGTQTQVTWNTSNPPDEITNKIGRVILAKGGIEDVANPIATNFSILAGQVSVTVPDVEPGNDYQVVLFGDSGNFGPVFSIVQ